jgi:hypothetical protein
MSLAKKIIIQTFRYPIRFWQSQIDHIPTTHLEFALEYFRYLNK